MKRILLFAVAGSCFLLSCEKSERGQYPLDSVAPGGVKNVIVENVPGGARLSYTIPEDEDLLYVKVIYKLDDGRSVEQKASAYASGIDVVGTGRSAEQEVELVCGDRSKNESQPVTVKIHPLDAPIYGILGTLEIRNDFGGIRLDWKNPTQADAVINVSVPDATNHLVEVDNFYTNTREGKGNIRGFPAQEQSFAVFIRDRWGNRTDTIISKNLPLHEERLDKTKFTNWSPPGIPYLQLDNNWTIAKLWNNSVANPGYSWPLSATLPSSFTFDMGQLAKLSRFKIFQRATDAQLYTGGNVKQFQLWGSSHPGVSDDFSTWVKLGDFSSFKPSGLPLGQVSAEDMAYAGVAGEDYNIDLSAPPVRYLRFVIESTWGGSKAMQIMEVDFFGNITNP